MLNRYAREQLLHEPLSEEYYLALPTRMLPPLYAYILDGKAPGHFLTAVICNNLRDAVNRADEENLNVLQVWIKLFYNHMPPECYGSQERMLAWMNKLNLRGGA
tara:strand:+ start:652 stop:963 length:312 start_codon:yes stop_codon:yes gene_type:complete